MGMFHFLMLGVILAVTFGAVYLNRDRGIPATKLMLVVLVVLMAVPVFAQGSLDLELDLSNFWEGFNQFFNALFPPLAFIASISAALGFIFVIVRALQRAFSSGGGR